MELAGKNVIYIGGFGGIGEKCVEEFLKKAVKSIIIFDLISNDEYLKHLKNTYKDSYVDYVELDLTSTESIHNAFKEAHNKIGSFDVVVHGSGTVDEQQVEKLVQINLTGPINSTLIAMEYMSKAKGGQGGCIVAISSTTALNPTEVVCIYGATKSALSYFTRTLAKPIYFDKTGIRFITVFPGATKTKMLSVAGERSLAAQYFPEVKNVMSSLETQSTAVFAEKLIDVVETAPNGSTVVIDEGTVQEITIPEVWGPAIK